MSERRIATLDCGCFLDSGLFRGWCSEHSNSVSSPSFRLLIIRLVEEAVETVLLRECGSIEEYEDMDCGARFVLEEVRKRLEADDEKPDEPRRS